MSDRPLLLSPDDPFLLASSITVNTCSVHTEALKRVPVALWDHSAEQRSNVPGAGLLGAWPSAGHTGEVSLSKSIQFFLVTFWKVAFLGGLKLSSSFRHANAVVLNGLFVFLFRQETVEQLLSNIFDKEKNDSAIVSVIQILLTLFETRRPA